MSTSSLEEALIDLFAAEEIDVARFGLRHSNGALKGKIKFANNLAAAAFGRYDRNFVAHLNNLAAVVRAQGRYPEAEALFREALEIDAATIGTTHPDYATHLNNLAGVVRAQGRYPEAEALFREALEIDAATIGTADPDYAAHLNNLAGVGGRAGAVFGGRGAFPRGD